MSNKLTITSLPEWLALPNIEPLQIGSPAEKGSVYELHKAGFLIADKTE